MFHWLSPLPPIVARCDGRGVEDLRKRRILEFIPTATLPRARANSSSWQPFVDHLGRGREVPFPAFIPFHSTRVKTRMENPLLNYSPRARYKSGTETCVS